MSGTILDQVLAVIRGHRFLYTNEDELQEGIAAALAAGGLEPLREVRLSERDRIDLLVGDIGIEVKVAGGRTSPYDQLQRYSKHDAIEALVLVTNRGATGFPAEMGGKPLHVVSLAGAGL